MLWIQSVLDSDPGRTFLQTPEGHRYSYRVIHELSGRLASALASLGVDGSGGKITRGCGVVSGLSASGRCIRPAEYIGKVQKGALRERYRDLYTGRGS